MREAAIICIGIEVAHFYIVYLAVAEAYFEVDLVNRLQTAVEKQRGQIKKLDQSALDLSTENEELRSLNDRMTTCNRDLRRKFRAAQSQLHEIIDERAELTAKVKHKSTLKYYLRCMNIARH